MFSLLSSLWYGEQVGAAPVAREEKVENKTGAVGPPGPVGPVWDNRLHPDDAKSLGVYVPIKPDSVQPVPIVSCAPSELVVGGSISCSAPVGLYTGTCGPRQCYMNTGGHCGYRDSSHDCELTTIIEHQPVAPRIETGALGPNDVYPCNWGHNVSLQESVSLQLQPTNFYPICGSAIYPIGYVVRSCQWTRPTIDSTWTNFGQLLALPEAGLWLISVRLGYTPCAMGKSVIKLELSTHTETLTIATKQDASWISAISQIQTSGTTYIYLKALTECFSSTITCSGGDSYAVRIA
jgi:hypothetical protein